ncbi:N-acetyltransferase [Parapedobacter sp. ISTM3]|uniref:GNAT family N-acetyltransferase n=1 Tax=Parapedobacter sp. ISTM3 TaxID=2800130 RepID=UPI001905CD0F|nr:GNAT family N-acetyltransferase [Parapedobacter sp. ISTM3]MBK1438523.1 N-acetyltransferase [Parapedobacter sp. ISTM3]
MELQQMPIVKDETQRQYQLTIDGQVAFIDYKQHGKRVYLIHTEVPATLEGRGVAASLVGKVFTHIEQNGELLIPLCPYVQAYLKRHPEWNHLMEKQPNDGNV